jgi:hypothetical protein
MSYFWESIPAPARLGHHANSLLIASIVGVVAVGLHPLPGALLFTVPLALAVLVIYSWLLMRQHDRSLCETCVHSMPLNPAARANRMQHRFWMAHTGAEPRFLLPYMVVVIGSNFAATSPVGKAGWALVQLSLIYLVLSQSTHRKLQPWCPWCREGGGGEDVDETPPVLPHDDRQLV